MYSVLARRNLRESVGLHKGRRRVRRTNKHAQHNIHSVQYMHIFRSTTCCARGADALRQRRDLPVETRDQDTKGLRETRCGVENSGEFESSVWGGGGTLGYDTRLLWLTIIDVFLPSPRASQCQQIRIYCTTRCTAPCAPSWRAPGPAQNNSSLFNVERGAK